ncbi:class II fructose-bisphosphate aldolase, partial [Ruthenibacterium lactatiformans]|uniref:class II fructose-bisphosphate aldolase n=1 Tax=Ruthenibacterium lactatiformans TaxID=1550024 RepID=UPI00210A48B7
PSNWKGLDFDALEKIHNATDHIPLVLHGGTGIPDDMIMGVKAIVGIAAGHNFVDNDTALQAGIGRDLAQRSLQCSQCR